MRRRLGSALGTAVLLAGMLLGASPALAANPAANLDQCANDPQPSPSTNGCSGAVGENGWVNGNLGPSKSVYFEGDSIPYRMTLTNLVTGSTAHRLIIEWDTTKGGKHAIDYIDSVNQSVATANPCLGISGCSSFTSVPVPADPQVTAAGVTPLAGAIRIYGGSITSLTRPAAVGSTACTAANSNGLYCYSTGSGFSGDKSAAIQINFTASVSNPVIAWGGHIATRANWGQGNSAGAVSGSPYHMRLIDLDGAGGNQDRSLSADAVILPATITIVKNTVPDFTTSFGFTDTGGLNPTTFNLVDDGVHPALASQAFSIPTSFTTYTFTEGAAANYTLSFVAPVCVITSPNNSSFSSDATARTLTINLHEGENYTCTFTNTHFNNAPTVNTQVKTVGADGTAGNADDQNVANGGSASIGAAVYDTASLSGATAGAGGTMQYYVKLGDSTCSTTGATDLGSKAVTSGVAVRSNTVTLSSAGTYYFWAVYSGDVNNNGNTSSCSSETVVVGPNHPGLTTTTSPSSGNIGTTLNDSATLTGSASGTGTITFYLFGPGVTCNTSGTNAVYSSVVSNVTGDGTVQSTAGTASGNNVAAVSGTFHWVAVYSDGANNVPTDSGCTTEPVSIGKSSPTLGTTPNPASGSIGTALGDSASLSGGSSPTGNITFYLFAPGNDCSNTATAVYTETVLSSGGSASTTGTGTGSNLATQAGTYHWAAHYAGDSNNNTADSLCGSEPVTIGKSSPTLGTTPSPANGSIGTALGDSASLSGGSSPTGNITFYLFAAGDTCSSTSSAVYTETVLSSGGSASTTGTGTGNNHALVAGTYHWAAHYAGDTNNNSADSLCGSEPVTIGKNSPTLGTTPSPATGSIGTALGDSASLTGGSSPTGNVTFYLFAPGDSCADTSTAVYTEVVASSGGSAATTGTGTGDDAATVAGTYHWAAHYEGDANNNSADSACGDEPVTIAKNSPTLGTTPSPATGSIGSELSDTATLSGASNPTGNITFYLFAPGDTCADTSTAVYREVVASSGDAASTTGTGSGDDHATVAGTYHWAAHYEGDSNNDPADSACGDEPVTIAKNSPTLGTTPSPASGAIGDALNDSASLSGASNPTGNITFYLFAPGDSCADTSTAVYSQTVASSGGSASTDGTGTGDNHANVSGTYHWAAHYEGDANNDSADSACGDEPVDISKNTPKVDTTPNLLPNDEVVISNLADPGAGGYGDLIVELRQGDSCASGTLLYGRTFSTGDAANLFSGNGTYDTDNTSVFVAADATIRWCTTYSGDANNAAFGPDDTGEVISIDFNPAVAGFALGFAVPVLGWFGLRLRRRQSEED